MEAIGFRQRGLEKLDGGHASTIKNPIKWNLEELAEKAKSLEEAHILAEDLVNVLTHQYEENSELLLGTTRMLLRPGLPYQSRPKDPN